MKLYLGGHLNFYHPQKDKWLGVDLVRPTSLVEILEQTGVPLGEVHLVVVNGEIETLQDATIAPGDEVKLFSAVGGG